MVELLYKDEVYAIIGAAMDVYNTLGPGFAEAIYQEALGVEMSYRGIPHRAQQELIVYYKNSPLQKTYVADYIAYDKIVVEIKALDQLGTREEAQLLNYLKATNHPLGLLINFGGADNLEWKRMVATQFLARKKARAMLHKVRED